MRKTTMTATAPGKNMSDYDAVLREMAETLGWVKAKLQSIDDRLKEFQKQKANHDDRLMALERWKVKVSAVAAAVATGASVAINWLLKKFGM